MNTWAKIEKACGALAPYRILAGMLLALLLSGCLAVQNPSIALGEMGLLHPGSTYAGLEKALSGGPGSGILQKGDQYLMYWIVEGKGTAYAVINNISGGMQKFLHEWKGKAAVLRAEDWQDFKTALQSNGWQQAAAGAVPTALVSQIAAGAQAMRTIASAGLPSILILPATLVELPAEMKPVSIME